MALCILFKLSVQLLLGHIVHLVSPSSIQLLCVRSPLSCWGQGRIFFFRLFYLHCMHRTLHSRHNVHQTQCTVNSFVYIFKSIPMNSQWWFINVTVMIIFSDFKRHDLICDDIQCLTTLPFDCVIPGCSTNGINPCENHWLRCVCWLWDVNHSRNG